MSNPSPEAPAAEPVAATVTVKLVEPIAREAGPVSELVLRKPRAGELRGLKIGDLVGSDVAAVMTLLPRITAPFITEQEAAGLSSEDIAEAAGAIVGFFLTPAQKAMIRQMSGG